MKTYSIIALAVVSVVLAVVLFTTRNADNAQLAAATGAIVDFSNRLDTAEMHVSERNGSLIILSNILAECQSASAAVSNRLTEAQSTLALNAEQIAKLTRQVAAANTENQALNQRVLGLTNQVAGISGQLAQTQVSLTRTNQDLVQAGKDYALLENRFRRDVAERVLVEHKFNTYAIVKAQLKKLYSNSVPYSTPESIYAGLNVEVKSNGECHVIWPD
jgi:chromosome segregation ATPase